MASLLVILDFAIVVWYQSTSLPTILQALSEFEPPCLHIDASQFHIISTTEQSQLKKEFP